jgi:hypothetical protein
MKLTLKLWVLKIAKFKCNKNMEIYSLSGLIETIIFFPGFSLISYMKTLVYSNQPYHVLLEITSWLL